MDDHGIQGPPVEAARPRLLDLGEMLPWLEGLATPSVRRDGSR